MLSSFDGAFYPFVPAPDGGDEADAGDEATPLVGRRAQACSSCVCLSAAEVCARQR